MTIMFASKASKNASWSQVSFSNCFILRSKLFLFHARKDSFLYWNTQQNSSRMLKGRIKLNFLRLLFCRFAFIDNFAINYKNNNLLFSRTKMNIIINL